MDGQTHYTSSRVLELYNLSLDVILTVSKVVSEFPIDFYTNFGHYSLFPEPEVSALQDP